MVNYETLMLAPTEITEDELSTIENQFDKICNDVEGKLSNFDKWGKYQLAYPVKNNSYGIYILARYALPKGSAGQALKTINTYIKIKCSDIVIRYTNIKLEPDASTTYFKPEALDARSTGDLNTFLEKNKIENLLDSVESSTKEPKTQEAVKKTADAAPEPVSATEQTPETAETAETKEDSTTS